MGVRCGDGTWKGIAGGGEEAESRDIDVKLSDEHTSFEWVELEEASERLRWASNRAALGELHERLSRGVMPSPV